MPQDTLRPSGALPPAIRQAMPAREVVGVGSPASYAVQSSDYGAHPHLGVLQMSPPGVEIMGLGKPEIHSKAVSEIKEVIVENTGNVTKDGTMKKFGSNAKVTIIWKDEKRANQVHEGVRAIDTVGGFIDIYTVDIYK